MLPDLISSVTHSIPSLRSLKGTRILIHFCGFGIIFNTIFVITPRVPSEPIIRFFKSSPELFFIVLLPTVTSLPSPVTIFSSLT